MDELIGFVTGNNTRQKILALLGSKGELDSARIAKTTHIVPLAVNSVLAELLEKELVVKTNELYQLTELGGAVERQVHNM
ncbi:MAG: transcriptional regulator [Gammaproteobacteria bacterium]|nr:transcriptional regulator [Gammaproteobacteria bacterium]